MTIPVHHVNSSDATYMQEMIALLREGVRDGVLAGEMASRHGGDPQLRTLAQESSASASRQITAMISCLDDWNADTRPGTRRSARVETPVAPSPPAAARPTGYDVELAELQGNLFDARVAQNLRGHHRAVITRSRQEMIEGLNPRSRAFARDAISQHSGELRVLEAR